MATNLMRQIIRQLQVYAGVPASEVQLLAQGLDELEPFGTEAELLAANLDNGHIAYADDTDQFFFRRAGSWETTSSSAGPALIEDADNDTRVETEASADEDIIRLTAQGAELFTLEGPAKTFSLGDGTLIGDVSADVSEIIGANASATATGTNRIGGDVRIFGGIETPASGSGNGNVILAHDGTVPKGFVGVGTVAPATALDVFDQDAKALTVAIGSSVSLGVAAARISRALAVGHRNAPAPVLEVSAKPSNNVEGTGPAIDMISGDQLGEFIAARLGAQSEDAFLTDGTFRLFTMTSSTLTEKLRVNSAGALIVGTGERGIVAATGRTVRAPDVKIGGAGDVAGTDLIISAGLGTGVGTLGEIKLEVPVAAAAGDNIQTRDLALTISDAGVIAPSDLTLLSGSAAADGSSLVLDNAPDSSFALVGGTSVTDVAIGSSSIAGASAGVSATGANRVGGDIFVFGGDETPASGVGDGNVLLAHDGSAAIGSVGIGTDSPEAALHVETAMTVGSSGGTNRYIINPGVGGVGDGSAAYTTAQTSTRIVTHYGGSDQAGGQLNLYGSANNQKRSAFDLVGGTAGAAVGASIVRGTTGTSGAIGGDVFVSGGTGEGVGDGGSLRLGPGTPGGSGGEGEVIIGRDEGLVTVATGSLVRSPDVITGGAGDVAGADLTFAAGLGTGVGTLGEIKLEVPAAATAGDNIQTRSLAVGINSTKVNLGVSPAVGTDPIATTLADFFDYVSKDILVAVGGSAVASVDVGFDLPADAMIMGVAMNIQTAITGAGGATAIGLGIAATEDKYGETSTLTLDSKSTASIGGMVALASSEDIKVFATNGAGTPTGTIQNGSVRIRIVYATMTALPNA